MTEEKKVLSLGAKPKLELKKPVDAGSHRAAGVVQQQFSHGRRNAVVVEAKRERKAEAPGGTQTKLTAPASAPGNSETQRQLTQGERDARIRALRGAALQGERKSALPPLPPRETAGAAQPAEPEEHLSEAEKLRRRELEELRRIQDQERQQSAKMDKVAAENRARTEEARQKMAKRAGDTAAAKLGAFTAPAPAAADDDDRSGAKRRKGGSMRERMQEQQWSSGRVNVRALASDEDGAAVGRTYSQASMRRRIERAKNQTKAAEAQPKVAREVTVPEALTVQELANRMAERGADVIKVLMKLGVMATITQTIDADTAELVAGELGHKIKRVAESDVEIGMKADDKPEDLKLRPPVVTVMGHVDHGKTSLLDALRQANVVAGEAGGITQHIGAYQVVMDKPQHGFDRITFIDTPGHAAFTEMRARGAQVTDIVILVVAADDGIMPQTQEAIRHAKAANVPMVVAINKCDLPAANPQRVKTDLLQHDVQVEDMGGDVLAVEISAKTKKNLDKLLEAVLLQAEILDLKANPGRAAEGAVVEAKMEKGRGSVATVLVQKGTLKTGDIFVCGAEWGRVRALVNDLGKTIQAAPPAMPVEVLGLNATPQAGDDFIVVESEMRAREISDFRQRRKKTLAAAAASRGSLQQMMDNIRAGQAKELAVIIKGDVHGSIEAIKGALEKLTADNAEVKVRVLDSAVGAITESDITLATATKALIIGFNVRANPQARELAKRDAVEIRYYSIIYQVIDDVKQALGGLLSPEQRERTLGHAAILQVFNISKVGKVAGCKVADGVVKRGAKVRLVRDNVVIHEGTLKTLKRIKDEVKEVKEGLECGMAFENYDNIQAGDTIECFELEQIARQL